jgi:hypothetical protein
MLPYPPMYKAMADASELMRPGVHKFAAEMFDTDPRSFQSFVSGFIFRPPDNDDELTDEQQERIAHVFVLESHFVFVGHPQIGSTSTKQTMVLESTEWRKAIDEMIANVAAATADPKP